MLFQTLTFSTILLQMVLATTPVKYCSQSITATYDDIQGAAVTPRPLPQPYKGLNYTGWLVVTNANVAGVQGSVLQVQTPPTSIFFGDALGKTSTNNNFIAGPGVDHFTLSSLYFGCVAVSTGTVGLGGAAGGVNVPVGCTVRASGTTTSGQRVDTDLVFQPAPKQQLFKFPATFANLKSVNFVLVTTSILSGVTDVDFDSVAYTLYSKC